MKAADARGVVRAALNTKSKELGYTDFDDFLRATDLGQESLPEVIWIMRDLLTPHFDKIRKS